MKKVTRILGLCALMALVTVSCKKNENTKGGVSFLASITQPTGDAKTHIGTDNYLVWNENDAIKVYNTAGDAEEFTTSQKDVTLAEFTGDITETDVYYACYPESNTIDIANATATLALNAAQQYAEGGFANGAYPMVAINDGKQFNFRSPFGVLCLQLKGTATVGSIELTDSNMGLAGEFTVALADMTAIASSTTTSNTITLSCGQGVALNNETAKNFFMVVPAGAFAQGFTAVVKDMNDNTIHTLAATADNTMLAEHILAMPIVEIEYATPSVTTNDATNVAIATATINGEATAPAGTTLTECGFYWGTSADALTNKVVASATSPFSYDLTGLSANTTYYFKAYAVNQTGENYGEVKNFTTKQPVIGDFTVGFGGPDDHIRKVTFAPGNLWYDNGTWRLENNQWEYHNETENAQGLFCWSNATNNYGLTFTENREFVEWGNLVICKPNSDETYPANYWRTLTSFEQAVLLEYRETNSFYTDSYGKKLHRAMEVNGVNCMVVAPDNYEGNIDAATWDELEAAGAFAMPMAGGYEPLVPYHFLEGTEFSWWSSTVSDGYMAQHVYYRWNEDIDVMSNASIYHMFSVRLVKNTIGWE